LVDRGEEVGVIAPDASAEVDAEMVVKQVAKTGADVLITDSYRINETYQRTLEAAGISWLQFDAQIKKPIWAKWIFDSSPSVKMSDYDGMLCNSNSILMLGLKYALISQKFRNQRVIRVRDVVKKVLVIFGGGDDRGGIIFVLNSLVAEFPQLEFHVVSGSTNPANHSISDWVRSYGEGRIMLHVNPADVPFIYSQCDIAVLSGGGASYEAAFMGLPMLLVLIADNQTPSFAWENLEAGICMGKINHVTPSRLRQTFKEMINDNQKLRSWSKAGYNLVDGLGAQRVVDTLFETTNAI
jgi:spore coat polysaccharide biosynthesis predicted glycosyltransferase SpsG